jgi:toxin-antitoxin system PIN domain toxin
VILIDVNLLLYATLKPFQQHEAARAWLDERLSNDHRVGFPWAATLGFLRIATNARTVERPLAMKQAWAQVEAWLAADPAWIPQPTPRHAEVLGALLGEPGVHGNLVPDAHLAALAIEHGLTLCSTDGDFARFRDLRWINPLTN